MNFSKLKIERLRFVLERKRMQNFDPLSNIAPEWSRHHLLQCNGHWSGVLSCVQLTTRHKCVGAWQWVGQMTFSLKSKLPNGKHTFTRHVNAWNRRTINLSSAGTLLDDTLTRFGKKHATVVTRGWNIPAKENLHNPKHDPKRHLLARARRRINAPAIGLVFCRMLG